jgi:hypothetical protein
MTNAIYAVRVKVDSEDTVEVLKKMIAAQMGTDWQKIVLKKWWAHLLHFPLTSTLIFPAQVHDVQESYHAR